MTVSRFSSFELYDGSMTGLLTSDSNQHVSCETEIQPLWFHLHKTHRNSTALPYSTKKTLSQHSDSPCRRDRPQLLLTRTAGCSFYCCFRPRLVSAHHSCMMSWQLVRKTHKSTQDRSSGLPSLPCWGCVASSADRQAARTCACTDLTPEPSHSTTLNQTSSPVLLKPTHLNATYSQET